jgi:hypothetical protein
VVVQTDNGPLGAHDATQTCGWLEIPLVYGGRAQLALDDHVGHGEPVLGVTLHHLEMRRDVAGLAGRLAERLGRQALVEEGRIVAHRLDRVEHRRQDLVLHVDQIDRLLRDVLVDRGHGSHRVSPVEHLVAGEEPVAGELDPKGHLIGLVGVAPDGPEVPRRDDGEHPWERLGATRVDGLDSGVSVRAAQYPAGHLPGQPHVGAEDRRSRHLIVGILPNRPSADDLVSGSRSRFGPIHGCLAVGAHSCTS